MKLFLKNLRGKTNEVNIEENATVSCLKTKVFENANNVRLFFAGRELKNEWIISEIGVCNEATLHVVERLMGGGVPFIEVTMFCTKGDVTEKLELELNPHVPISGIKSDLACRLRIAAENQRLIFNGRVLPDTSTLMQCEVESGAKLSVEDGSEPTGCCLV